MTLATILLIAQIISAVAGGDWAFMQIAEAFKKEGGIEAVGQNLLEVLRGQATPPTLDQLKQTDPGLHAKALVLLAPTVSA